MPLARPLLKNGRLKTLVFCDKISYRWIRGFPSNKGVKKDPDTVVILPLHEPMARLKAKA